MSEGLKPYTEKEIELSYKGRCISDKKEVGMGYMGSCSMSIHRHQLADENSWVSRETVSRWIKEVAPALDGDKELVEALEAIVENNGLMCIDIATEALAKYKERT